MDAPHELGSERFTRLAKAAWPNVVGLFGLGLIFFDCVLNPPPDATSGIGLVCVGATGFVNLNRFDKRHPDE